jgi:hypothetical protein
MNEPKACAETSTLNINLDSLCFGWMDTSQDIIFRNQLIESLPQMKLMNLGCFSSLFKLTEDAALMSALYKNATLTQVWDTDAFSFHIVRREISAIIDMSLLGGGTKSSFSSSPLKHHHHHHP